jgi:hypothetical protein
MLQILQEQHAELFELLGKTSGRDVDKIAALKQRGVALEQEYGLPVIAGVLGCLLLWTGQAHTRKAADDEAQGGEHSTAGNFSAGNRLVARTVGAG